MRIFVLFLCLGLPLWSQSYKPTYQSNPNLSLDSVLAGIKHVYVTLPMSFLDTASYDDIEIVSATIRKYLNSIGLTSIGISEKERKTITSHAKSLCDVIDFYLWWYYTDTEVTTGIQITTCNTDNFEFESVKTYKNFSLQSLNAILSNIFSRWTELYTRKVAIYDPQKRLNLPVLRTNWNEESLKEYFLGHNTESIEGIYEKMKLNIKDDEAQYRIAVVKSDNLSYNVIYLSGALYVDDWQEGEIKAVLFKSAVPNYYKVDWYMSNKSANKNVYLQRTQEGILEFIFPDSSPVSKSSYFKTYPVKW